MTNVYLYFVAACVIVALVAAHWLPTDCATINFDHGSATACVSQADIEAMQADIKTMGDNLRKPSHPYNAN